jgi:ankyrin repeat protein
LSREVSSLHIEQSPSKLESFQKDEDDCIKAFYLADYATKLDDVAARAPGTCEWVLDHQNFRRWVEMESSALLWLSGHPGCGKTVISSFLIKSLRARPNTTVIYFICDNKHGNFRTKECVLRSLLHQLLVIHPDLVKHALPYFKAMKDAVATSAATLWNIFEEVIQNENLPAVFCILDALDECEDESREWLMNKLGRVFSSNNDIPASRVATGCLKMLVTSRPWEDIEFGFLEASKIRLKTEEEDGIDLDIHTFINEKVNALAKRRRYTAQEREIVTKALTSKANGMFLWVSLIIKDLERTPKSKVHQRLETLPKTLFEVYAGILSKIEESAAERVKHILTWVVTALRPLNLEELAVACELHRLDEVKDVNMDDFLESIRGDIGLCGPILAIRAGHVELVHQSAKDFLLSTRQNFESPCASIDYRIKLMESDGELAVLCLRYLSRNEFNIEPLPIEKLTGHVTKLWGLLEKHPFLEYSAHSWPDHFRNSGDLISSLVQAVRTLFRLRKNSAIWFQTFFFLHQDEDEQYPSGGSSLHYAVYLGILPIVRWLLDEEGADVNVKDAKEESPLMWLTQRPALYVGLASEKIGIVAALVEAGADLSATDRRYKATPLHWSIWNMNYQVAKMLITAGADVNARECDEEAPLHWLEAVLGIETVEVAMSLLEHGAFINAVNLKNQTALHHAVENIDNGDQAGPLISFLLEHGASINAVDLKKKTPLHVAIKNIKQDNRALLLISLLLEKGADANATTADGNTPLLLAMARRLWGTILVLLKHGAAVDAKDPEGKTVLHLAAEWGRIELVEWLIEQRVDTKTTDLGGMTAMELAVINGHENIVQLLANQGNTQPDDQARYLQFARLLTAVKNATSTIVPSLLMDINFDSKGSALLGRKLLEQATANRNMALVELLLEKLSAIVEDEYYEQALLQLAADSGHNAMLALLLNKGANIETRSSGYNSGTALHIATSTGNHPAVQLLLEKGANVNAADNRRLTPLMHAAEMGNETIVNLMLQYGAATEVKELTLGSTALGLAVKNDRDAIVRLLLEYGAEVEAINNDGETPLHDAAIGGHLTVMEVLMVQGHANVDAQGSSGQTPLMNAAWKGEDEAVRMLVQKGADVKLKDVLGKTALDWAIYGRHKAVVQYLESLEHTS